MKQIFFYINTIHTGGAERVLVNLCNYFSESGYDVSLILSYKTDDEYEVSSKVNVIYLENQDSIQTDFIKKNVSRTYKIRRLLKEYKPDMFVSFMAEPNFRALISAIGLKTKNVISVRNDPEKEYPNKIFKIAQKILFPLADGVVFQTSRAKMWFPEKIQAKSRIIMNPLNPAFLNTTRANSEYLVACGRLVPQKNYIMMINAFSEVLKVFPDEKLYIYGEGKLKSSLNDYIISNNLSQSVKLMGITDNVPDVLKNAKIYLLSSDYEGMPNALLEAMAVGLPCIATDCPCGGPAQVIKDNENGVLVPVGDDYLMSQKIIYLLENPDKAEYIGRNARKTAENCDQNKIYGEWHDYLKEVFYAK